MLSTKWRMDCSSQLLFNSDIKRVCSPLKSKQGPETDLASDSERLAERLPRLQALAQSIRRKERRRPAPCRPALEAGQRV